ncbi:MAG: Gldg family protein [Acidobacteria bacterium]|nr:Gldg family protein [Acidobacteriota bacterium]
MLNRLLGALAWLGSLLVFVAVGVWLVRPELEPLRQTLAIAGLACILVYGAGHWRQAARSFERRQTRYGALAGAGLLLGLVVLVALNYVLARQNKRWDLTAAQQYSLSDQTRRVLTSLESPVRILVFARETDFPIYQDRLDAYAYESSQVTVDYIDADRDPVLARQYDVESYGTIVFDYDGRVERVLTESEQDLTNALIKVVAGREETVYFLAGHGERDVADPERNGYSTVSAALAQDNYQVNPLVLAQQSTVPDDATVVVVAGPQTDLLPGEVGALRAYMDRGGKLLVLLDPPAGSETATPDGLLDLLGEWGVEAGTDIVVDGSGMGQLFGADASVPVAADYPSHPITEQFNLLTAYPLARSVRPTTTPVAGRIPQPFIQTSPQSWAEANIDALTGGEVELNEEVGDRPGPIVIGVAVSAPAPNPSATSPDSETAPSEDAAETEEADPSDPPETRMVVIGDSDFATNGVVGIQGNRDMFLNAVSWLAQQENLIAIRPREPDDRRLTVTADQQRRLFWLSILFIPAAALGTGVYTWWRRR